MTTVTKLKAAVNNKKLPILGIDGNLYSYYVGRWQNAISELGYAPTSDEVTALEAFIADGINNGWIDKVKYFMPLIGSEAAPLTGIVPLIDNVADYALSESAVDSKFFSYNNGKIKYMGGRDDNANIQAIIPCTSKNLGLDDVFSFFADLTYTSDDVPVGIGGTLIGAYAENGGCGYLRKGNSTHNFIQYISKNSSSGTEVSGTTSSGTPTIDDVPLEIATFYSRYTRNNTHYRKRYTLWQTEPSPRGADGEVVIEEPQEPTGVCQYKIGTESRPLTIKVNCVGVLDPEITNSLLFSFCKAVFGLTLALGRRSA